MNVPKSDARRHLELLPNPVDHRYAFHLIGKDRAGLGADWRHKLAAAIANLLPAKYAHWIRLPGQD
jgi:hypothetical protein